MNKVSEPCMCGMVKSQQMNGRKDAYKNFLRKEAVLWILHGEVKVMKKRSKVMKESTLTDSDTTY